MLSDLLHHPEYNTSLILRAEILEDTALSTSDAHAVIPPSQFLPSEIPYYTLHRLLTRRLLPRSPKRDTPITQYCTFYHSLTDESLATEQLPSSLVILTPELDKESPKVPFYHPPVSHLAFRYIPSSPSVPATLRIEVVPLPPADDESERGDYANPSSRLYRTCLALLETVFKHGWGFMTGYKKRVVHDTIVDRAEYQDLYLVIRDRFAHLVESWPESTDPQKHVFEDIAIATFLILVWKHSYPPLDARAHDQSEPDGEPWGNWPRPPDGFVDLGCGNGLLVHILVTLGYKGFGIDLRARKSWALYPSSTQECLRVQAFDPTLPSSSFPDQLGLSNGIEAGGVWIIGNHADEMTPWIPLLCTLISSAPNGKDVGFLSIPCCAWNLDAKFVRGKSKKEKDKCVDEMELEERLGIGKGKKGSSYSAYVLWLASLTKECGFEVECEALRIPSTRNWAIIGRKRTFKKAEEGEAVKQKAEKMVEEVRARGIFKTRKPEGNAGNH
ncbi:hypothetical protein BOTBODRAFT_572461 [Botryobasidium botryosum FD-172 SS1]|uniref:tRNA (uracil-O(2)-)-methyltransferase n=1 Tax=Botryobasidium botryosum (strain FD-172 SS1) TaxID=930990 RepID=A0A067M0F9_BOTB1|nr:hypothetical protein BOTBODRAFT_572461 [Botryobasidium botryosum FD-172 SS1]